MIHTGSLRIAVLCGAIALSISAGAQDRQRGERTGAAYLGPVHPYVFRGDLRALPKIRLWRPGDPIKEVPKRRKRPKARPRVVPVQRTDPLLGRSEPSTRASRVFTAPTLDIAGQVFSGVNPPDTVGDAGPGHYIQMINNSSGSAFTIYDKTGTLVAGPTTVGSLGSGDCATGLGDPIVLYDQLADRWMISEFSDISVSNTVCIYVSQTGNPVTGGWYNYAFTTPNFPDYPKYSVWPDAYYLTSNESGGPAVYALERAQMLAGGAARLLRVTAPSLSGFGFQALTPVDADGVAPPPAGTPGLFVRHVDDEVHGSSFLADTGSWQAYTIDISSALGSSDVVLQFMFDSVDNVANNFEGFHIDDVDVAIDGATIFSEDFEGGTAGWTQTGLWNTTTACSASIAGHTTPTTYYYGQDDGETPACDYDTGGTTSGTLTSPAIDMSSGSSASLSFNFLLETEQGCNVAGGPFDVARVEISTNGGSTFDTLVGNCDSTPPLPTDNVEIFEFTVDWVPVIPTGQFTGPDPVPVADFDSDLCGLVSFSCFPQPRVGRPPPRLDPLREVVMWRAQYRNFGAHQALTGSFVTDVTGADQGGVRWFELRKAGAAWELHQQGTYAPDAVNRWMSSIAMDGGGNIALGYNVSDATSVFPGIRYTGRLAGDSPGSLPFTETTLIAGAAANSSNRYGDYSAMSVDPSDDCSFWFTGQHNPASNWSTRIGRFGFDGCTPVVSASCSGVNVVVSSTVYDQDTTCVASHSWAGSSAVAVTSQSKLEVYAPITTLGPDFSVEAGSSARFGPQ